MSDGDYQTQEDPFIEDLHDTMRAIRKKTRDDIKTKINNALAEKRLSLHPEDTFRHSVYAEMDEFLREVFSTIK